MDFEEQLAQKYEVTKRDQLNLEVAKEYFSDFFGVVKAAEEQADSLIVNSTQTEKDAVTMTGETKRLLKQIEARRKDIIDGPSQFVKSVNGFVKVLTEGLESIETILTQKRKTYYYQKELERQQLEAAQRKANAELQAKLDAQAKEIQDKLDIEAKALGQQAQKIEAPKVVPITLPPEPKVVRGEGGISATIRREWKPFIVNENLVPREYCSPDMAKIRQAVKGGLREIPGVEIREEIIPITRT
jgi:hypothetical protein